MGRRKKKKRPLSLAESPGALNLTSADEESEEVGADDSDSTPEVLIAESNSSASELIREEAIAPAQEAVIPVEETAAPQEKIEYSPDVQYYRKFFNDHDYKVRAAAARAISLLETADAIVALGEAGADAHPKVRAAVALALRRFEKDKNALKHLAKLAKDPDETVRMTLADMAERLSISL
jgi:HEAT repeat protein